MSTAVITGGAGFLGSHLYDKLLNKKIPVICIDNLPTGNLENIQHLFSNKHFQYIKYDIANIIFMYRKKVD